MNADPIIGKTPSGSGWKAYAYGQPNAHLMDWRGMNIRIATVPGQPHRGFSTQEAALAHIRKTFVTTEAFARWSRRLTGTFVTEQRFRGLEAAGVIWRGNEWVMVVRAGVAS